MNPAGQFVGECRVDGALAFEPRLAAKGVGNNYYPKMGLAPRLGTRVAAMLCRLVDHLKPLGSKFGLQLRADAIDHAHLGSDSFVALREAWWRDGQSQGRSDGAIATHPCVAALVLAWTAHHTGKMRRMAIEYSFEAAGAPFLRPCDHPGCAASGDFRAPRSRADLQQFYWFCLDHVRAYNAAWNYYAGMSEAEIEAEIRNDTVWQRPTWPLGSRLGARFQPHWQDHGLFDDEQGAPRETARRRPRSEEERALIVFDLTLPLTLGALKTRYKELVKQHHPDSHGGDKIAEERLKEINQAYSTLKTSYFPGS
jgi:DnaJ domain